MDAESYCTICGNPLTDGRSCHDYFHQMLVWDFEDFTGAGQVHHLTVLCYYLQHPNYYSQEALIDGMQLLGQIIKHNMTEKELYERNKNVLDFAKRDWKIKGTDENHGQYTHPVTWTMTADAVIKDGVSAYPLLVRKWARCIYKDLEDSNNLK